MIPRDRLLHYANLIIAHCCEPKPRELTLGRIVQQLIDEANEKDDQ